MSRYTLRGSPELDQRIDADLARVAAALAATPEAPLFRGLVLLGGYGRGEGTPLIRDGAQFPFNDYDLIVVSQPLTRGRRAQVQACLRQLEERLTRDLGLPVDLCLYPANHLPGAEFSLLNYELKHGHRVVWGDPACLAALPAYPHNAVPLSEGTRLLLNRGKLLLDLRRRHRRTPVSAATPAEREQAVKFIFKAWLAFGDCALLLGRRYHLLYAEKKQRLTEADLTGCADAPAIVRDYRRAIEFKEWGDARVFDTFDLQPELARAFATFQAFFFWYESGRLGAPLPDAETYAKQLRRAGREGGQCKALALNLMLFKSRCLTGPWRWLAAHPRLRLYAILPGLVADDAPPAPLAARLLCLPATASRDTVETEFLRLRLRLS